VDRIKAGMANREGYSQGWSIDVVGIFSAGARQRGAVNRWIELH
jgi:hypothetical protein